MRVASAVLALFLTGCFGPTYKDCEVSCAMTNACPSGLACLDGMCRVGGNTGVCGGGGDGGNGSGDGGPNSIPLEQLGELQANALCSYMVRCGMMEDVTTCLASLRISLPIDYLAAVGAGKIQYHGDKAKQCLDAITQLACTRDQGYFGRSDQLDPACNETFTGTIGGMGACKLNEECISQDCMPAAGCPGPCCAGTCNGSNAPAHKNLGEPCGKHDTCNGGFCDNAGANSTCQAYKAAGQACNGTQECDTTAFCDFNTTPPLCRQMSATGGQCTGQTQCIQLGDVCRSGTCTTGGLAGYACTPTNPACQVLHGCVNGGTCEPPAMVGQSCAAYPACQDGYCRQSDRICAARLADGKPCDPTLGSDQCESGFCDPTGSCATPAACF
jgi:hypothetical protein